MGDGEKGGAKENTHPPATSSNAHATSSVWADSCPTARWPATAAEATTVLSCCDTATEANTTCRYRLTGTCALTT